MSVAARHLLASAGPVSNFSWNLLADLRQMLGYAFMRNAFEAGAIVAVVAGVVGYFVVLRRTAFAAHALSHIGFAGAAGAVAVGVIPLWGLLAFCLTSGAVIGGLGQRLRERDTVIGIVLAFALGLGALFISLYSGSSNEAISILFGEILGVSTGDLSLTLAIGLITLALVAALYRPLLFTSVDEDVAEARRVPVRMVSVVFMMTVALAVAISVQVVGVLLIFGLMVTPAAIAERVCRSPGQAMLVGVAVALGSTWLGLAISWYFAYPVSFFIISISFVVYAAVRVASWAKERAVRATAVA
ncbi:MAG: metal ABC transporter permease [Acidimicrobiales bacterium]